MNLVIICLGIAAIIGISLYNSVIGKKNAVGNAFASIDVMLKKRHDLIPNLVASVQRYMTHEAGVLAQITQLRTQAQNAVNDAQRLKAESQISKALSGIMVSVENYPQLKADGTFLNLQQSLNEAEEQISAARRAFNAAILDYNNCLDMFPTNIVAGFMGLSPKEFFEIEGQERTPVDVKKMFS